MSQEVVFNHHSLPFDNQLEARKAVPEFIRTALMCRNFGYNLMLLDESLDSSWFEVQLAPQYVWRNWYDEALQNNELKEAVRAFRSLQTRQPLLTEVEIGSSREVGLKGDHTGLSALLACHFHNTFLISFPSSDSWKKVRLTFGY